MRDDDIGYGRPPKKNQFRPGQSGNPKGRKKGCASFKLDFNEELSERITIVEDGIKLSVTKRRLIVKQLVNQALKGNIKASGITIDLMVKHPPPTKKAKKDVKKPKTLDEIQQAYRAAIKEGDDEE